MVLWRCLANVYLPMLLATSMQAQTSQFAFRISFKDKQGSANMANPLSFLSQRAIDRRVQMGIVIDTTDLPVAPPYLDSVLNTTQGALHVTSRWLNQCVILLDDSSKILLLQNKPFINTINYVAFYQNGLHNKGGGNEKFANEIVDDGPHKPTGTQAYYNGNWDQTNLVHGDCLHDKGYKGQGKLIAVLDDGFNYVNTNPAFDSLYTSGRILDKHNFVKDTNFIYGYSAHGTEVLSTMAVYLPNTYVGAAPLAQYALYITEDNTSEQLIEMDNMIAGFERADSIGADVVSTSLGYNTFFGPTFYAIPQAQLDGKTTIAAQAANMAAKKGILMVITAGNEGSGGLLTPGDADSALTIGNVLATKIPATSSGTGPNAAGHIKPDVCALGNPAAAMRDNTSIVFVSGTSLSTPQIAGYAVCMLQGTTLKKPYEVKDAIRRSGHTYSNPSNNQLGYGVPDFCTAYKTLGIDEFVEKNEQIISIYPNPLSAESRIIIKSTRATIVLIAITDIAGKLIFTEKTQGQAGTTLIPISMQNLANGYYNCRITTNQQTNVIKLMKN